MSQVRQWDVDRKELGNTLDGHAINNLHARPKRFVAPDDLVYGAAEHFQVKRNAEAERVRLVVRGVLRAELIEQPKPSLPVGKRNTLSRDPRFEILTAHNLLSKKPFQSLFLRGRQPRK